MTDAEKVKLLREALTENVDRLSESRPDVGSPSDDPRQRWFERNRALDRSRTVLATTAEPSECRSDVVPMVPYSRLMAVAEAVREACSDLAYNDDLHGMMLRIDNLDLAAVVAGVEP